MSAQPIVALDPWAMLALLGCLQGLLLGLALASIRPSAPAARALLALILTGALAGSSIALAHSGLIQTAIFLTLFEYSITLMAGPLLLLLARTTLDQKPSGYWVHFLPAAAWMTYVTIQTVEYIARDNSILPKFLPPILWIVLHQMTYTGLALATYLRSRRKSRRIWGVLGLQPILAGFVGLHVVQLLRYALRDLPQLDNVVPLGVALAFSMATWTFVRAVALGSAAVVPRQPYAASSLKPEGAAAIEQRLFQVLEAQQLFLDAELTVARMASRLHVPQAHLSQVINQRLGRSFSELVADYRVREAQRLLLDSCKRTVEDIAGQAGFQSRSAFYEAFKRRTGLTPTAFRRRNRPES